MIFNKTTLEGVYLIDIEKHKDERGFFARTWCRREFEEHSLNPQLVQCNLSYNKKRGTLRGMHFQAALYEEAKLVSCTQGAIFDVVIDMRSGSPTFKSYLSVTISAEAHNMLYVPEGFAHGFLTLTEDTYVYYQMSEYYTPEYARGVRWDDPAFGIKWPENVNVISERDANYPDFIDSR
jgi:dTDP-4-dehydrorhamnose 3,5-epimerase